MSRRRLFLLLMCLTPFWPAPTLVARLLAQVPESVQPWEATWPIFVGLRKSL